MEIRKSSLCAKTSVEMIYLLYSSPKTVIIKIVAANSYRNQKADGLMPGDKEMINNLINNYTSLQRIKKSNNSEKELDYQIKILKAKLELFGIITTDLDL